jgi:hypothetical protein
MQSAISLASVFGPMMAIVGLWMLLYNDNMVKVLNSTKTSPAAFYTSGWIHLFLGLVVVSQYNVWSASLAVLVTLLGWAMIVRGILTLYMPQVVVKFAMSRTRWLKGMGLVPLVWGLLLTWYAFYM